MTFPPTVTFSKCRVTIRGTNPSLLPFLQGLLCARHQRTTQDACPHGVHSPQGRDGYQTTINRKRTEYFRRRSEKLEWGEGLDGPQDVEEGVQVLRAVRGGGAQPLRR